MKMNNKNRRAKCMEQRAARKAQSAKFSVQRSAFSVQNSEFRVPSSEFRETPGLSDFTSAVLCGIFASFAVKKEEELNAENAKQTQSAQSLLARGSVVTHCHLDDRRDLSNKEISRRTLPEMTGNRNACGSKLIARSSQLAARSYKKEISTVHHSKQFIFESSRSSAPFQLIGGERPAGELVKKAPRITANEQFREACTLSVPVIRLNGGGRNDELTIRAC